MKQNKGKENLCFKDRTGEKYISNEGCNLKIIQYGGALDIINQISKINFEYGGKISQNNINKME